MGIPAVLSERLEAQSWRAHQSIQFRAQVRSDLGDHGTHEIVKIVGIVNIMEIMEIMEIIGIMKS